MRVDWNMPPYPPVSKTEEAGPVTLEIQSDAVTLPTSESETDAAPR